LSENWFFGFSGKGIAKKSMITEAFREGAFKVLDAWPIQPVTVNLSWPILPAGLIFRCPWGWTLLSAALDLDFCFVSTGVRQRLQAK
jgi:hypothetical protein